MGKSLLQYLLWLCLLAVLAGCASNQEPTADTITDATVAVEETEHRIVATTMSAVAIFEKLNLDLVGVPTSSEPLPERYKGATEVGSAMNPDVEIIKSLKPTDVLSVTTLEADLASGFQEMNLPSTFVNLQSIADMQEEILALGEKYDRKKEAKELIEQYEQKVEEIQEQVKGKQSPKVLVLLGIPGSYLVATDQSYIGNLIELAGGTNAIQGQNVEFLASNTEYLHESNPDVILRLAHGMPKEVVEMFSEEFQTNDIWEHFNAVKNNRVYDLEEPVFGTTANLHAETALEELVKILYEE